MSREHILNGVYVSETGSRQQVLSGVYVSEPPAAYTLTAEAGSYAITGTDATLTYVPIASNRTLIVVCSTMRF